MLDTHAVARSLTAAEFTPAQADAIANAVRLAAERGEFVTSDRDNIRADCGELDRPQPTEVRHACVPGLRRGAKP